MALEAGLTGDFKATLTLAGLALATGLGAGFFTAGLVLTAGLAVFWATGLLATVGTDLGFAETIVLIFVLATGLLTAALTVFLATGFDLLAL